MMGSCVSIPVGIWKHLNHVTVSVDGLACCQSKCDRATTTASIQESNSVKPLINNTRNMTEVKSEPRGVCHKPEPVYYVLHCVYDLLFYFGRPHSNRGIYGRYGAFRNSHNATEVSLIRGYITRCFLRTVSQDAAS